MNDPAIALVTGGSRGIGRAITERLAADHPIAVTYRSDAEAAAEVVAAIEARGGRSAAFRADFAVPGEAERVVQQVESALGSIGVLVGNAGAASRGNSAVDSSSDEYRRMFQLFALSNIELARAAMPSLRRHAGSIVFVSSTVTTLLPTGTAPYAAGKAALDAAVVVMAREERAHKVRVNVVAPGLVATEMGDRLTRATSGHAGIADLDRFSPLGRVCRPSDIADAVAFLAGANAGYITGHRLVVDGGGVNNPLVPSGS
ncbi:SDR family oxidoreductase [Nocardia sp. NPDC050799]|uniref:SDR family NAD(P)-dependent oxidoreductase n=1 Tax=Nocardia sp. NPDC050799 TaxID=3154842 RepID=UPI0033EAAF1D